MLLTCIFSCSAAGAGNTSKVSDTQSGWSSEERTGDIRRAYRKAQTAAGVPVAFPQELLLLNNEIDPGHPAHNEPFWVRLRGDLNLEALSQVHPVLSYPPVSSLASERCPHLRTLQPWTPD